ncbi:hypothetical protein [Bradyrhizobium liaoningense]
MTKFKCWLAGKLIKLAFMLLDADTREDVVYLLGRAADRGMLRDG